jgi:hypothetical protein
VALQIGLFCGAYFVYRIVRGLTEGQAAAAFENAQEVVALEKSLGLFFEPAMHAWVASNSLLIDIASWTYVNSHFTITVFTLAFMYLFRNDSFYFVRNMFMVAMGISLILYAAYPTAPPRFLPELGFVDPLSEVTGISTQSGSVNMLFNPYAAVPSMHVGFALMLGIPMSRIVRRDWAKALWLAYPALVTFAVLATANHWWLDAFLGALTAAFSAATAVILAKVGPERWRWIKQRAKDANMRDLAETYRLAREGFRHK